MSEKSVPESSPTNESSKDDIFANTEQFYSDDPYEVLDVSRNADLREIKTAYRGLQKKYHPDLHNNDSRAVDITQRIVEAYQAIQVEGKTPKTKSESTKTRTSGATVSMEDQAKMWEEGEKQQELYYLWNEFPHYSLSSPGVYKAFREKANKLGVTDDEITEKVRSPKAQEVLRSSFLRKVASFCVDHPEKYREFFKSWREAGINFKKFHEAPIFKETLEREILRECTSIGITFNPDRFLEFVAKWKEFGLDFSYLMDRWEVKHIFETVAYNIYERSPEDFKPTVEKWMNSGWEPSESIMAKYKKAS